MNAPDPDLYGPPERGNEEPAIDDDWEALADTDEQETGDANT